MYFKKEESQNIIYSIDMLRLKTYLTYSTFTEIEYRFKTCWKDFVKKYWTTGQTKQFFYNYDIKLAEGVSFWFGFAHNNERRSFFENAEYNFTIEFNPNKVRDHKIIQYLLSLSGKWFIKSFDLALDVKVNILDLIINESNKKRIFTMSYGFDNKTIVCGKGDNRFKIYNKKKESGIDVNYELTRVEVSREFDDYPISDIKYFAYDGIFPDIYLNNYLYSFSDYNDKTLLAILYAVQYGFPIKDLSRAYKEKIKNMFEGGHKLHFYKKSVDSLIRQVVYAYFVCNNKIKWK